MPGLGRLISRRAGPVGLALTAIDVWRKLTPEQRKKLVEQARKHGPRVASAVAKRARPR